MLYQHGWTVCLGTLALLLSTHLPFSISLDKRFFSVLFTFAIVFAAILPVPEVVPIIDNRGVRGGVRFGQHEH